jgi:chromosome segregation ATPase
MTEKNINEYENLNQRYNELVQDNNKLAGKNLLLEQKEADLNQENSSLQKQIKNNEQRINKLLAKGSGPPGQKTSLGEEIKKADELKTAQEKIAKLEKQLKQKDLKKDEGLRKRLTLAEVKFHNSQTNAYQLSDKLEKKDQELKAVQKQNTFLNNQLAETKKQLIETTKLKEKLEEKGQNQQIDLE